MKSDPRRWALWATGMVLAVALAGCSAAQSIRQALPGVQQASPLGGPMATLEDLPYASMFLRVGDRFQALLLLGHVAGDGTQTWYGVDGLALQLRDQRVIYSRGLPVDLFESHAAGSRVETPVDCGGDQSVAVPERLHYSRLREQQRFFTEVRESVVCTREAIVTPGYSGMALRIDERVALLPDPRRQTRTRWLAEETGQLLRLEYGEHPWYPQIALYLIKPVAPR
ncbi:MAG: YjbF family lipoprotein [Pseudomonadota bacterium]|nr:YjbF family lipoprotein [Pseudomonadota bacterium]